MRPIEEIRKAFQLIHHVACGRSDRAYMSIPADPRRDADLIVAAALDELEQLRAKLGRAREALLPPPSIPDGALLSIFARVVREAFAEPPCVHGRRDGQFCPHCARVLEADPIASHCGECGKGMTKAEGGTCFAVCEKCWDKHTAADPAPSAETFDRVMEDTKRTIANAHEAALYSGAPARPMTEVEPALALLEQALKKEGGHG